MNCIHSNIQRDMWLGRCIIISLTITELYNDQHSTILNNIQRDMRLSRCIIISLTIDELYTDQHSTRHVIESMHNNIELTIIDELYIDQHSTRDMRLSGRIIILLTINQRIVYSISIDIQSSHAIESTTQLQYR